MSGMLQFVTIAVILLFAFTVANPEVDAIVVSHQVGHDHHRVALLGNQKEIVAYTADGGNKRSVGPTFRTDDGTAEDTTTSAATAPEGKTTQDDVMVDGTATEAARPPTGYDHMDDGTTASAVPIPPGTTTGYDDMDNGATTSATTTSAGKTTEDDDGKTTSSVTTPAGKKTGDDDGRTTSSVTAPLGKNTEDDDGTSTSAAKTPDGTTTGDEDMDHGTTTTVGTRPVGKYTGDDDGTTASAGATHPSTTTGDNDGTTIYTATTTAGTISESITNAGTPSAATTVVTPTSYSTTTEAKTTYPMNFNLTTSSSTSCDNYTQWFDCNENYVYLTPEQQQIYNSCPHGTNECTPTYPGGRCTADRCRFPLTSDQGQEQARLYVNLLREVYEYAGSDVNKVTRRTRIRNLINYHWSAYEVHSNGVFLPWHRWYILEMETILLQHQAETITALGCNNKFVGIPYFDWHNLKIDETPKEFINNANDAMGHHFNNSLGQDTTPPAICITQGGLSGLQLITHGHLYRIWTNSVTEEYPEITLHPLYPLPTDYDQFRIHLQELHNSLHKIVGGIMGNERSSNDPIFFTHHANTDKIWHDWQTQSYMHQIAYNGSTELGNQMPASTATPSNVLDLNSQLYTPRGGAPLVTLSVEYVDMNTSSMWGDGNTNSRTGP